MNSLIIGTGKMARGISTRLLAGGHDVKLYNPDRADAEQLFNELSDRASTSGSGQVSVAAGLPDAIVASDVVILASWYPVNLQADANARAA